MTLVDTSVWVDHFLGRPRAGALTVLLEANEAVLHPWVLGELALGDLGPDRVTVLTDLRHLPAAPVVADHEVLELIETRKLSGRGVGWVDAQLVASALVASVRLWTMDKRLASVAEKVGLAGG